MTNTDMMNDITRIKVSASRCYEVLTASGILSLTGKLAAEVIKPCRAFVLTDDSVAPLYLGKVSASLRGSGFIVTEYIIAHGEASKNLQNFGSILETLALEHFSRTDIIVALGGGVVGDLGGFCASAYLRGIRYIGIPTTLLAAVDSSVGGKTAVDLAAGKNLCGAFWQPSMVICDTDTFDTLSDEIFADGIAESIKYGVICDRALFDMFGAPRGKLDIRRIVERCVSIKRDIVQRDEFESGERKLLNFGHTAAHSIEKLSGYTISHGHAVACGMVYIARAAQSCGYASAGTAEEIENIVAASGLPTKTAFTPEQLADAAAVDKKVAGGDITLVLPKEIGVCGLVKIPVSELCDYFKKGAALI